MSHEVNSIYADMVLGYINDNEGTIGGEILKHQWKNKDYDGIELTLAQIRKADFDREYQPAVDHWKKKHPKTGFNLDQVPF